MSLDKRTPPCDSKPFTLGPEGSAPPHPGRPRGGQRRALLRSWIKFACGHGAVTVLSVPSLASATHHRCRHMPGSSLPAAHSTSCDYARLLRPRPWGWVPGRFRFRAVPTKVLGNHFRFRAVPTKVAVSDP